MSLFYSDNELIELTGSKYPSKQIQWLKDNNIRFIINSANKPVVFKRQVEDTPTEDDGLLTRKQIARKAKPIKSVCGIYFLLSGSEIVYVGQSINLIERIGNHLRNDQMDFDSYCFIEAKPSELSNLEKKYIKKLLPRLNKKLSKIDQLMTLCGEVITE